jgi:transcriptional regulator with XRE-family HTH domain
VEANERIRAAREVKGISLPEAARLVEMTVSQLRDIEDYADEIMTSVPTGQVRRLCELLDIKIAELLGGISSEPLTQARADSRAAVLRSHREAKGLTVIAVADELGFDSRAVEQGESQSEYLDSLPLEVLAAWARMLEIPVLQLVLP